ncbi:MAG: ABC transporter permease [Bacillota bacterium]
MLTEWWGNLRVVAAVVWQRALTFRRYPANFWSSLVTPFFSLATAVFLARAFTVEGAALGFERGTGTADYHGFLLFSTLLWIYIDSQLYLGFALEREMRRGTLQGLFLAPVPRWCYLAGHSLYQLLRASLDGAATLLLGLLVFGVDVERNWLLVAAVFGLNLLVVWGYGIVLAAAVLVFRSGAFTYVWSTLLPLLAGETFSISVLPPLLQVLGRLIPLTYGLDLLRWAACGSRTFMPVDGQVAILVVSAVLLPALGLACFHRLEQVARRRGTLGQF